jgi:hypothetical protein
MPTELVTEAKPAYLGFVFGPLTSEMHQSVVETVARAGDHLFSLADALRDRDGQTWEFPGIKVMTGEPAEAFLFGAVESDRLGFCVGLTPEYRPLKKPWRPWNGPRPIDAWELSAEINRLDINAVDYDHVSEDGSVLVRFPGLRLEDPERACQSLVAGCSKLRELALSRPASIEAWRAYRPG